LFFIAIAMGQESIPKPRESGAPYAPSTTITNHANESVTPFPIDLGTAVRLADSNSPLNAMAAARLKAALARQELDVRAQFQHRPWLFQA
jgi:hypothetical protein